MVTPPVQCVIVRKLGELVADPPIRIVSEQTEKDIERNRTREEVGFVLREMAANLLRIIRGAGKGYHLMGEMIACVKAFQDFHDAHGHWPDSYSIQKALEFDEVPSPPLDAPDSHWDEWNVTNAEMNVCKASLRIAAARLLEQKLQEDHGHNDLRAAIDGLERAREKRRARYAAELRPIRPVLQNVTGAPVPKSKKEKHVLRYSDGTPVVVGKRKKPPGDEPSGSKSQR
jgi:hypothetical protein